MSNKTIWAALFVAALVFGCTKKEEATETIPSNAPAVTVTAAAPVVASANPVDEDDPAIVLTEDLEAKAKQEISATNLEAQLDDLEKEIGKSE